MKKAICLALSFAFVSNLAAETFVHKFIKGEKYRIVTTVEEKVLRNDKLIGRSSFLNKIAVEITDVVGGGGRVTALYQISERQQADTGSYRLDSEERSSFSLDPRGRYTVSSSLFYPAVRDIPLFPSSDIQPDSAWTAPGVEIHDLREAFGIRTPVKIPVTVKYKFLGMREKDGRQLAIFQIEYQYVFPVTGVKVPAASVYPIKISGAHSMTYYWDVAAGKPAAYKEEFYALYNLSNREWIEFMGTAKGEVIVAEPLDKEEAVEDIKKEIEKENLEGVRVEPSDQGVKITLENVQFQPDSDLITPAEAKKLETIAAILKKYPDRDIRLEGHTAAVGTPESCLDLSIRRAAAVGDALLRLGARRPDQLTIVGKGLTEPLAPNDTEAGRIKNRRVEIIILEN